VLNLTVYRTKNENDIDPFRLEEEMARLMAEKEAAEAENVALSRQLGNLQDHLVCTRGATFYFT